MATVYVLVGVPAAGKSTWAKAQAWADKCAYISTDHYVEVEAARQGKTYNEVFTAFMPTAVKLMAADVIAARNEGKDIIWDQTSTTIKSRRKKFNMLPNYTAIAVIFDTPDPLELSIRLKNRPGKNIPISVMISMVDGFEMPTAEEGFNEIWRV